MESNMNSALAISDILIDSINKKYDSIRDLNSIKVNISEEGFDDMNPVIDSIIEEENNHIGKLQQLVDLLTGGEEEIAEGKEETIDMIDNSDEFMESMTTMKKKLILSENFDNVIDDIQAVEDNVFVKANKEHDENKKNYEAAIKENEKEAKETIPKEGETGKKVTSKELKAMKLSEAMFDFESQRPGMSKAFELIDEYGADPSEMLDELLRYLPDDMVKEFIDYYGENFLGLFDEEDELEEDELEEGYHLQGEAVIDDSTDLPIGKVNSEGGFRTLKGGPTPDELDKEELRKAIPNFHESLSMKIAKEQLKRFAEGKMPSGWTVDAYLTKLTEKKHITEEEQTSLKEWFVNEGNNSK